MLLHQRFTAFVLASALVAFGARVQAATIIGPGNTTPGANDTAVPLYAVDLNNPQFLSAGTYLASSFNYQFTTSVGGSVTPALEISNGSGGYTTIAVGNTLTIPNSTATFASTPFGGSNSFVVPAGGETVYGAVYSSTQPDPIGFAGVGSSYLAYGLGALAPSVGTDVSGGTIATFPRTYDFSISVSAVPEPSTLILCGLGTVGLIVAAVRRRKI